MMLIPEAWDGHLTMTDDKKSLLRIPLLPDGTVGWGPASIVFTDGHKIGRRARSQWTSAIALLRPGRDDIVRHGFRGSACWMSIRNKS
jgi:glutamate synthase domain-containing protein 1